MAASLQPLLKRLGSQRPETSASLRQCHRSSGARLFYIYIYILALCKMDAQDKLWGFRRLLTGGTIEIETITFKIEA